MSGQFMPIEGGVALEIDQTSQVSKLQSLVGLA
jgi:hypothetical protein